MKEITLAAGCFWGVEAYFKNKKGILETEVGYANGHTENPTYEDVCIKNTGYAEVCRIKYDEEIVNLEKLLEYFWKIIDPLSINRQGGDVGSQYRSGIYFTDKEDLDIIRKSVNEEQKKHEEKIATEVKALDTYYKAEEYHQEYLKKNPDGYCHIDINM